MFPKPGKVDTVKKIEDGFLIRVIIMGRRMVWCKTDKQVSVGDKVYLTIDRLNHEVKEILTPQDLIENEVEPEEAPQYNMEDIIEDDYGSCCD